MTLTVVVEESGDRPVFTMPKAGASYELAGIWVETGAPSIELTVPEGISADLAPAFGPRDSALIGGKVKPKDFPVNVALLAFAHVFGDWMLYVLAALSGTVAVVLVWSIAVRLGADRVNATLATLMFPTSVAFLGSATNLGIFDVTAATMILLGVYGIFRLDSSLVSRLPWAAATGASLGLAVGLRYPLVVVVAVIYLAVLLARRFPLKVHAAAFGGFALVMVAIAVYHTWLYGGPLDTGYSLEPTGAVSQAVTADRLSQFAGHVRRYLLTIETGLPLGLGIIGMGLSARRWRTMSGVMAAGLFVGFAGFLVITGSGQLWGSEFFRVDASFLRYSIPVLGVASAFAALVLARMARFFRLALVGTAVVTSLVLATLGPGGLASRVAGTTHDAAVRKAVLDATPADSIVMSARADKLLWPERHTFVISYLVEDPEEGTSPWGQIPNADSLAATGIALNASGFDVFMLDYSGWASPDYLVDLDSALAARQMHREVSVEGDSWVLYRVNTDMPHG